MSDLDVSLDELAARLEAVSARAELLRMHEGWETACEVAEEGIDGAHPAARLRELVVAPAAMPPAEWLSELERAILDLEDVMNDASERAFLQDEAGEDGLDAGTLDILTADDFDG